MFSRAMGIAAKILLLACLVTVWLPASPALAQGGDDQVSGGKAWDYMVQSIRQDMSRQRRELERVREVTEGLFSDLEEGLSKADNRFDQVMLLEGLTGNAPWAYRTLIIQLRNIESYIELKKTPLTKRKDQLSSIKSGYSTLRMVSDKERAADYSSERRQVLAEIESDYHSLKTDVAAFKKVIDEKLAQADELKSEVAARAEDILKGYADVMRWALFEARPSALTPAGWVAIPAEIDQWTSTTRQFWVPVLVWIHWADFLWRFAAVFVVLLIAGRVLARKFKRLGAEVVDYRPGWVVFSLGLAGVLGLYLSLYVSNAATDLATLDTLVLGLLLLTRRYLYGRLVMEEPPLRQSPLLVLFAAQVTGDLVQVLFLPHVILQPVWLAVMALCAWRLRRLAAEPGLAAFESTAARVSFYVVTALAVASPLGFAYQAMVGLQAWFMLMLTLVILNCVRQIMCGGRTFPAPAAVGEGAEPGAGGEEGEAAGEGEAGAGAQEPEKEEEPDKRPLDGEAPSLAGSIFYPLTALAILALFVAWVLLYVFSAAIAGYFMNYNLVIGGGVTLSFNRLVTVAAAFFVTRVAIYIFRMLTRVASLGGLSAKPALLHTVETIGRYVFWVLFVLFVLTALGVSLSALTWIASGLSVGIGFGMKDIVNNFVSGMILLFGGTIKKGDIIQKGQIFGEVADVSIRNTTVKTLDNNIVIIPNSKFLSGEVTNWSYKDSAMRLTIPITVVPGTKVEKMEKVVLKVAKKHPKVLKEPPPAVIYKRFGQIGLEFELYVWISDFRHKYQTQSDLAHKLDKALQEKKIKLAFRGIKTKYKPKGSEAQQLEAQRAAIREKRNLLHRQRAVLRSWSRLAGKGSPRAMARFRSLSGEE